VPIFDEYKYPPFGYHEFEQSEIQSRRLLILYSAKTTSILTKTQSSHRSHPPIEAIKQIPLLTPRTAPAPPQSATPEHPAPPFARHYMSGPADAARWTPTQEYQAWKTPLWYRHPSISSRPSSQWFCSYILPPHPYHGLSGLSFFQPRSKSSSGPGTCSGVPGPAR